MKKMANENRLIDTHGSYRLDADDYTGCAISFNDGIITVTNDDGCYICEFDAKKLPTVDAVEVVHGRWIYHLDDLFPIESTQECSVCHEHELCTLFNESYCPNCGAKMDGDKYE